MNNLGEGTGLAHNNFSLGVKLRTNWKSILQEALKDLRLLPLLSLLYFVATVHDICNTVCLQKTTCGSGFGNKIFKFNSILLKVHSYKDLDL